MQGKNEAAEEGGAMGGGVEAREEGLHRPAAPFVSWKTNREGKLHRPNVIIVGVGFFPFSFLFFPSLFFPPPLIVSLSQRRRRLHRINVSLEEDSICHDVPSAVAASQPRRRFAGQFFFLGGVFLLSVHSSIFNTSFFLRSGLQW